MLDVYGSYTRKPETLQSINCQNWTNGRQVDKYVSRKICIFNPFLMESMLLLFLMTVGNEFQIVDPLNDESRSSNFIFGTGCFQRNLFSDLSEQSEWWCKSSTRSSDVVPYKELNTVHAILKLMCLWAESQQWTLTTPLPFFFLFHFMKLLGFFF